MLLKSCLLLTFLLTSSHSHQLAEDIHKSVVRRGYIPKFDDDSSFPDVGVITEYMQGKCMNNETSTDVQEIQLLTDAKEDLIHSAKSLIKELDQASIDADKIQMILCQDISQQYKNYSEALVKKYSRCFPENNQDEIRIEVEIVKSIIDGICINSTNLKQFSLDRGTKLLKSVGRDIDEIFLLRGWCPVFNPATVIQEQCSKIWTVKYEIRQKLEDANLLSVLNLVQGVFDNMDHTTPCYSSTRSAVINAISVTSQWRILKKIFSLIGV